jgi:ankyrin repeat protein
MHADWEAAIKGGDVVAVRGFLDRGVNINGRDRYGQTGLMLAARAGHREVVEALVERRADLNVTAKFGLSALMLAVVAGHAQIARILARAGADLSKCGTGAPGFADQTAYDLAMARGMRELSEELSAFSGHDDIR